MKKQSAIRLRQAAALRKSENLLRYRGHTKRKGELSELAFLYKAASMGFGVAKPYGDSERFDFIVSSGCRLWRVQVKSTYKRGTHGYGVHTYGNRNRGAEIYTSQEIDFIAVYLVPEDIWYIVPIEVVGGRQALMFHPHGTRKGMYQYEKYREAWRQMKSTHKLDATPRP
jgi:hypothetical protein